MATREVLIVGAGPTGMVLAIILAHNGIKCRIIDTHEHSATTSRALAVHARTLELYASIGLAEEAIGLGVKLESLTPWVAGRPVTRINLGDIGAGLSPFPFVLILPQNVHEELLARRLQELGVIVERGSTLVDLMQDADGVLANIEMSDGTTTIDRFAYVAGCDGAHSATRHLTRLGFPGGTYQQLFYVADVEAEGPMVDGGLHVALGAADFMAVFPMRGAGSCRLVGIVPETLKEAAPDTIDIAELIPANLRLLVKQVRWISTYQVHHRVADRFARGRVFLLGDAGHLHSPAGGQGMNTGIGDAFNLGWKLAAVLSGRAAPSLLESYTAERRPFAERLVATTDRGFGLAVDSGRWTKMIRLHVAPRAIAFLAKFQRFRHLLFKTISQTAITYHGGPLGEGRAGHLRGGDRMPWLTVGAASNIARQDGRSWHIEVVGPAACELEAYAAAQGLVVIDIASSEAQSHGLLPGAMLLIRPDGHIAIASDSQSTELLEQYRGRRALAWGPIGVTAEIAPAAAKERPVGRVSR